MGEALDNKRGAAADDPLEWFSALERERVVEFAQQGKSGAWLDHMAFHGGGARNSNRPILEPTS